MHRTQEIGFTSAARFLLVAGAFVVVVAGLKAASTMVTLFLLSAFIAMLLVPPLKYMQSHGMPTWAAMLLIVAVLVGAGGAVLAMFAGSVNEFNASLPIYQQRVRVMSGELVTWLDGVGVHVSRESLNALFDPMRIFGFAGELIRGLGALLTNAFMILLTVMFMLFEANSLPSKLRAALRTPEASLDHLREVMFTINRYMFIKACISLVTGLLIWAWLSFLGVAYAAMWGMLAFLLNFVPTIGSIIAAVPAVLLALIKLGIDDALLATLGFMVVNIIIGNFIEPRVMGRGLGLSTLVVFLSLVFWGFVLGPAGMFLSVPLTMALKIAFGASPQTYPIAIMLGPAEEARAAMAAGHGEALPLCSPRRDQQQASREGAERV
jgi:AI-2 transport protein TqsA